MTDGQEQTIGEIGRATARLERAVEELTSEIRSVVVPVSTLNLRMTNAETNLLRLDGEVKAIATRSASIAGGIGVLAFLANWFRGH